MRLTCPICGSNDLSFKVRGVNILQILKSDDESNIFGDFHNSKDELLECNVCHYSGEMKNFGAREYLRGKLC